MLTAPLLVELRNRELFISLQGSLKEFISVETLNRRAVQQNVRRLSRA
jgi:hypothetical protein